jgi:hypothetical protein
MVMLMTKKTRPRFIAKIFVLQNKVVRTFGQQGPAQKPKHSTLFEIFIPQDTPIPLKKHSRFKNETKE